MSTPSPTDLIDRIDVVTGGNSAIYGSDAIGGVVNFVLRRNFDGLQIRAQDGISSRGDGNAMVRQRHGRPQFRRQSRQRGRLAGICQAERHLLQRSAAISRAWRLHRRRFRSGRIATNGSDGIPDRIFVPDIRSLLISEGGTFQTSCIAGNALTCLPNGQARIFQFQPNGTLAEADNGRADFRPLANSSAGGERSYLAPLRAAAAADRAARRQLLGHFDVNRRLSARMSKPSSSRNKVFQQSSPSFDQPALLNSGDLIGLDNPFLTPETRAFIAARLPAGATSFRLNRNNLDLGVREESIRRDTYRVVLGVEGDLSDGLALRRLGHLRRIQEAQLLANNRVEQRYAYALDAVRSPPDRSSAG
jgi:outer membrane receptor protein involved in Fe transport